MNKIYDTKSLIIALTTLFIFGVQIEGEAQSVWVDHDKRSSAVGVEIMIPSLTEEFSVDFPSSALVLYGHFWVSDNIRIDMDLPISHLSVSEGDLSETDIGNPYVGLGFLNSETGVSFDFGLRLPLAPDFNFSSPADNAGLFTGIIVENYNLGKYIPETFSITSEVAYRWQNSLGWIVKVGGGPDLIIPSGDADTEFFLNYHTQFLYGTEDFRFGAGFTGLLFVTESNLSLGDRTIHDLGLISAYNFGPLELGAYLRFPLDDEISSDLDFVMGLNLLFTL